VRSWDGRAARPAMSNSLFLGTHSATIDAEGRIQLPASLRDELSLRQPEFRFVATLEGDGSVCLREREQWDLWARALVDEAPRDQRARATLLTIAAHSAPVKCDRQGRIRVPDSLLSLVGVDRRAPASREVVLVGGFAEIRLWSPAAWEAFAAQARADLGGGLDRLLGGVAQAPE